MLEELRLNSVGGVASATLELGAGLVAVTGESGAGKSSLVRGLELLCGKRSPKSLIQSGQETAGAEAYFFVPGPLEGLEEELQPQDRSFSIKREISRSGRGKCSIQGQPVPLNRVAEVAPRLMSIQSQFAQLELLEPERQMKLLDACGGPELAATRRRLEEVFYQVLDCEKGLRQIKQREQHVLKTYGSAEEVMAFLKRAGLEPDSEEKLNRDYGESEKELARLRELRNRYRQLQNSETGGLVEEFQNLFYGLSDLLSSENREKVMEACQQALGDLETLAQTLSELAPSEKIDALESDLDRLETTLGHIRKCKRLANVTTLSELLAYWKSAQEEMDWLAGSARLQSDLNAKMADARRAVAQEARKLREQRTAAAALLQERVTRHLADLAMENSQFRVRLTETNHLRANGAENVEFVLLRAGDQEIPVAKAASGGELSRILLAIQLSLPDELMPPTVVFDEVEAGLGGRAAYLTGLKLRQLADRVQVILITHEASIAALANQHYLVERAGDMSKITPLMGEDRVGEIARMLSGNADEPEARNHARKLLKLDETDQEERIFFDPSRKI